MVSSKNEITQLLMEANRGNGDSQELIFPIIYSEIRHITHRIRFHNFELDSINTTAIIHEAYLKLISSEASWNSRAHFYGVAAKAMRIIFLNAARRKKAIQRGFDAQNSCFAAWEDKIDLTEECCNQLLNLEEILIELEIKDSLQVKVVECRLFANMTVEEVAAVLAISTFEVKRMWRPTKLWLNSQLKLQKTA